MNNEHSALIDIAKRRPNRRKKSYTSIQNQQIEQQSRSVIGNQLLKISEIKVGKRFRKDLGNIDDLIESIRNNGLLCPIVVTKGEYLLIDGARRIEAYRQLCIPDIPVHVVDIPIREDGEIDANLVRKNYTVEEVLAIKKYRESVEPNFQGKRSDLVNNGSTPPLPSPQLRGNFPRGSMKERRQERIAKDTGFSYKSLARLEVIADTTKKHPELGDLPKKIDSGKMKLNKAWTIVKTHKKREQFLTQAKRLEGKKLPDGFKLIHGDCRQKTEEIPDDSVDLIFTDPPYDRKSLLLYADLGKIAERVLKPGGSLVVYAPHYALLEIGSYLMQLGLKQVWTICVKHTGHLATIFSHNIRVNWKPLLWLVKGQSQSNIIVDAGGIDDFIISTPPDKSLHEWAQSLTEADYMIKRLTIENQVVLDCFMGSGTTGIAALNNKRQFIGIEIDQQTFDEARANIEASSTSIAIPVETV